MESTPATASVPEPERGPASAPGQLTATWWDSGQPPAERAPAGEMFVRTNVYVGAEEPLGSPLAVVVSLGGGRTVEITYSPEGGGTLLVSAAGGAPAAISAASGDGLALMVVADPHTAG